MQGAIENAPRHRHYRGGDVTILDLSNLTGFSKSTISRVINNEPNVNEKTREIVLNAIKETNYKPNAIARGMITGKLPMVLIIVGDIQNYYFARTVVGIESVLDKTGYMPVVYNSGYDEDKELRLIETAKQYRFTGVIPMTALSSENLSKSLDDTDIPIVLINKGKHAKNHDGVFGDEEEAGYLATKELIENGNTSIAYIGRDTKKSRTAREREKGYTDALTEHGIEIDKNLIFKGNLDVESGYRIAEKIFGETNATAICCNNYLMAAGVIRYADEIGKKPLIDYDIACCEPVSEVYGKDIIYAGPDLELIGAKAAELLLKRINGSKEPYQKISFAVTKIRNPKKTSKGLQ